MRRRQPAPEPADDRTLIRAAQIGDADAWARLAQRYARLAYAVPHVLGCSLKCCTTVCLQALATLAQQLPELPAQAPLGPHLVEAARRAAAQAEPTLTRVASAAAFETLGARLVAQHRVWLGVQQLSENCAALLTARHYAQSEAATEQIAAQHDLTLDALYLREAACVRRLLDLLAADDPPWERRGALAAPPEAHDCEIPFSELLAYATGRLRGSQLERLAQHLSTDASHTEPCPGCRTHLARLERVLGLMHTDQTPDLPVGLTDAARDLLDRADTPPPVERLTALPELKRRREAAFRGILGALATLVCLLGLLAVYSYWPARQIGRLEQLENGELSVKLGPGAPWLGGQPGQPLAEGAGLESTTPVSALVRFWDGSLLRIESPGTWTVERLRGSRNNRWVRISIRQHSGTASYASTPPRDLSSLQLRIELPAASLDLNGTATVRIPDDGGLYLHVHQGCARLKWGAASIDVVVGQELLVQPDGTFDLL